MLVLQPDSALNLLVYKATGKVTLTCLKNAMLEVDSVIENNGDFKLLILIEEGVTWDVNDIVLNMYWVMKNMFFLKKIAIVSSAELCQKLITMDGYFSKSSGVLERHYEFDELHDALAWLKGP
jgi:hypothetical protein